MQLKRILIEMKLERMMKESHVGNIPSRFVLDDHGKIVPEEYHGMATLKYPKLKKQAVELFDDENQVKQAAQVGDPELYNVLYSNGFIRVGRNPGAAGLWLAFHPRKINPNTLMTVLQIYKEHPGWRKIEIEEVGDRGEFRGKRDLKIDEFIDRYL